VVAAISSGSGIFATHFIAMLAFEPSIPSAYDSGLTVLSLVFAIGLTGLGLRIALSETPRASWLGGVVVGFGIAAMHYTGMAAFEVTGRLRWDPAFVFASILIGELLSAVAVSIAGRAPHSPRHARNGASCCSCPFASSPGRCLVPSAAFASRCSCCCSARARRARRAWQLAARHFCARRAESAKP